MAGVSLSENPSNPLEEPSSELDASGAACEMAARLRGWECEVTFFSVNRCCCSTGAFSLRLRLPIVALVVETIRFIAVLKAKNPNCGGCESASHLRQVRCSFGTYQISPCDRRLVMTRLLPAPALTPAIITLTCPRFIFFKHNIWERANICLHIVLRLLDPTYSCTPVQRPPSTTRLVPLM